MIGAIYRQIAYALRALDLFLLALGAYIDRAVGRVADASKAAEERSYMRFVECGSRRVTRAYDIAEAAQEAADEAQDNFATALDERSELLRQRLQESI